MFQKLKEKLANSKDKKQLKNLTSLFMSSPKDGIEQSQMYLIQPNYEDYDTFITEVKKTQKSNCCICSWTTETILSARCLDCQLQENSCICIPCYLAGKHDQHHSYLLGGSGGGNCDCGDPNFWKKEGNCPHHPGPDEYPERTQMTSENSSKFIKVFGAAYNAALSTKDDQITIQIFEWIESFISFGDGLRRCVAIAVSSADEKLFFKKLLDLSEEPLKSLLDLLGKLTSDRFFAQRMGAICIKNYLYLRSIIRKELLQPNYNLHKAPLNPAKRFLNFAFHFFDDVTFTYMINELKLDWVEFAINCIQFVFDSVSIIQLNYEKNRDGQIVSQLGYISTVIKRFLKKDEQHNNIQRFINAYSSILLVNERYFSFTFPKTKEDDDDNPYVAFFFYINLFSLNCLFSPNNDSSPKNKNFSIDATFTNLLKFLTSQKDLKPISIYQKESVPISSFLPLHHLFFCLLSSYKDPQKILKQECQKNGFDLQKFCCLSSICPVRILAATFAPERFRLLNNAKIRSMTYLLDGPEETFNILFGLVQTMFKIANQKEEFLEMINKTFGVYDDDNLLENIDNLNEDQLIELLNDYQNQSEIRESSIFDSSSFIVSLITDNSISTFNKVLFKRLRVIELMTIMKPTAKDIEIYANDTLSNPIFGDDVQSFAERVRTNKESFFRLKDNQNEFTPFFPVISRKNRVKIIMSYGEKLIPMPQYELPAEYPSMKNCFKEPSFIYLMYKCITSNQITSKQVGLAMLVLAVKNDPSYAIVNESEKDESVKFDSVSDFFNYIKDHISDNKFNPLLVKFSLPRAGDAISIIDVLKKDDLGYEAFKKTDLPSFLMPIKDENADKTNKEKKERAANLKQALMKEFQNKRSQFTEGATKAASNDEEEDDFEGESDIRMKSHSEDQKADSSEIQCNICQTKLNDQILGFPCLSLPCIFPSIINNKLHGKEAKIETVTSFSICLHHVHKSCCMTLIREFTDDEGTRNIRHTYKCMIDRGIRNCFLPLFPDGSEFKSEIDENLQEAVESFMSNSFKSSDLLHKIKSFAGTVSVIEVRHRSRPECLDSPTVPSLLRNLLCTFYASLHGEMNLDKIESTDPLENLVFLLLYSESPVEENSSFVKQIAASLNGDDYIYEFLRRAAIIEDFALNPKRRNSENEFIDWDEIFSFENLIERYGIENGKSVELPLFETIPLADRFVGLYQPPYNLDIFNMDYNTMVDLLTGSIVFYSSSDLEIPGKPEIMHITNYVKQHYDGGLAMFLGLTGPNASDIVISCPAIDRLFNLDGFYVDQFGDIDRGFKRGAILSLSKDRLEKALDKLLSGDVILY